MGVCYSRPITSTVESTNMAKPKLTYFPIAGAAEKVRLAFKMTGTDFEDVRIPFAEWPEFKKTTPWGQVPLLELDGKVISQSYAMVRYAGKLGDGSLYPADKQLEIDEVIGVHEDMARAFNPCMYVGIDPAKMGHAFADDDAKKAKVKEMREAFAADQLPKFMGFYKTLLEKSGGPFFCGDKVTIADLCILPQIRHLQSGIVDYIPTDCINAFPEIIKWQETLMAVPAIKEWYDSQKK